MSIGESSGSLDRTEHTVNEDDRSCLVDNHTSFCFFLSSQLNDEPTHGRKLLLLGGLSETSCSLRADCCLLRSSEQERSVEYESVSSTRMEMGTDRLR